MGPNAGHSVSGHSTLRCSPSDLDADLEDNQDYDSTVSQSDVNSSRTPSTTALQTMVSPTPRAVGQGDDVADRHGNRAVECIEKGHCIELQQVINFD